MIKILEKINDKSLNNVAGGKIESELPGNTYTITQCYNSPWENCKCCLYLEIDFPESHKKWTICENCGTATEYENGNENSN